MTRYSILDLVPVVEGGNVATALANAADLAAHAESLGFARYWVAEHHGMKGIASAATSVVIGHIAAATKTIRVGSGGIMLPNHSPLVIAEQFGTLDALYPGRIDLGLGRAPGSDQRVAAAIRRTLDSDPNAFPRDVMELQSYFADDGQTGIVATPGAGANVKLYILGSSLYGAQVAGALGLPFAFASHFAPDMLDEALHIYRSHFRASAALDAPYAVNRPCYGEKCCKISSRDAEEASECKCWRWPVGPRRCAVFSDF
jgi:luciferase family oxidoreductase group 1